MIKRKAILPLAAIAIAAVAVPSIAAGRPAKTAAVTTKTVKVAGPGNGGYFIWTGATGAIPTLTFKLGASKVQWVWDNVTGTSQHDVTFEPTGSVTGLTSAQKPPVWTGDPLAVPKGTSDARNIKWPTAGWTPSKVGLYIFYCSRHAGVGKAHTGGMAMKVNVTR